MSYSNASSDSAVANQDNENDDENALSINKMNSQKSNKCYQSKCNSVNEQLSIDNETHSSKTSITDHSQENGTKSRSPIDTSMKALPPNMDSLSATSNEQVSNMADGSKEYHQVNQNSKDPPTSALKSNSSSKSDSTNSNVGLMKLNATKAGMDGLDTDRINAIIDEASKGSKFYEAKIKSQKRIDDQISKLILQANSLSPLNIQLAEKEANSILNLEQMASEMNRTIVHIDMDAFYAAVHEKDDPTLKTKPMAVGSMGMLSTSNYHARKFGVRAGMPGFIAKKLCPELTIIPTDFDKYREIAAVVRGIFEQYDQNYVAMSLDEAYLDLTDYITNRISEGSSDDQCDGTNLSSEVMTPSSIDMEKSQLHNFGSEEPLAAKIVKEIRYKIQESTHGLTASAGIAPNTMLAKVCSDFNKPNGQYMLNDTEQISQFVNKLPVRKVSGIGNVTEQILTKVLNVKTCGDLYDKRGLILLLFKPATANFLLRVSLGVGESMLSSKDSPRKSLSSETTFEDTSDPNTLLQICDELSADVAKSLNEDVNKPLRGKQITVKIKTHKFEIRTKVMSLSSYTSEYDIISDTAKKILRQLIESSVEKPLKLRLLGVRISGFEESCDNVTTKQQGIQKFMQKANKTLNTKYSDNVIEQNSSNKTDSNCKVTPSETKNLAFICPICNTKIHAANENAFNIHLDACLKLSESSFNATGMQIQQTSECDADNVKSENENLDFFHNICANYQEIEKAEHERKSNLNAFHNMIARTNLSKQKREANYANERTQRSNIKTVGYNSIDSFFDKNSKHIKESRNRKLKEEQSFNSKANNQSPNFFIRSTLTSSGDTDPCRSYKANKILAQPDLLYNETESCKKYSCMVRPKENMSDDVGHMPKMFSDVSSIEKDTSSEILMNTDSEINRR